MLDNIVKSVSKAAPDARILHFQPIDGGKMPVAADFDLVILTGGTLDLSQAEILPWAQSMVE